MKRSIDPLAEWAYKIEHSTAWLMATAALILGFLGWLRGIGAIHGTVSSDVSGGDGAFWDGMVLLVPAISAALIAWAWHNAGHHRVRGMEGAGSADGDAFILEHGLAWLLTIATVALCIVDLVIGLDVFKSGARQGIGLIWGIPGLVTAGLANAMHNVRHHQVLTEEDYIVQMAMEQVAAKTNGSRTPVGSASESVR